jgi:hypothetical protein
VLVARERGEKEEKWSVRRARLDTASRIGDLAMTWMSLTTADLAHTQPSDWCFVQQGRANVVVRYSGSSSSSPSSTPSSPLFGYVLRLRKRGFFEPSTNEADFSEAVVSRLIPVPLSTRSTLVEIPNKEWLENLAKHVEEQARSSRASRTEPVVIETETSHVWLVEDMIRTEGLSVEIKVGRQSGQLLRLSFPSLVSQPD